MFLFLKNNTLITQYSFYLRHVATRVHWEVNTDSSTYKEVIDIKQQRRRDFMSVRLAAAYLTHDLKTFVGDAGLKSKKKRPFASHSDAALSVVFVSLLKKQQSHLKRW